MDKKVNYGSVEPALLFAETATDLRQRHRHAGMWFVGFVFLVSGAATALQRILDVPSSSEMGSNASIMPGPFSFSLLGRAIDERHSQDQISCTRNKTLLLLRHAKLSWDDVSLDDFDRPLTKTGRRTAVKLGKFLQTRDFEPPDLICASPSLRTRETLALVQHNGWAVNISVVWDERLYNFDVDENSSTTTYFDFVRHALGNQYQRVLIVGHNPPIAVLAQRLLNSTTATSQSVTNFAPATFCELKWTNVQKWQHIMYGTGRLGRWLQPNDFPWT